MSNEVKKDSRLERLIEKLIEKQDLINEEEKGSIEINYSGKSETIQIKVVIQ